MAMLDPKQRQRFLGDNRARIGIGIVVIMSLAAILAPLLARQSPITIDLAHLLQRPSAQHWLGTDIQGRDIWSRLVYGARVSLTVGLISQGIALALGVTLGLVAGFYGKWVDEIVMRLADVTLAFPTLLLLIAMVAALQPSEGVVFATIGIVGWAGMARIVRGQVLVVRQLEYIQAIRALGARRSAHHDAARAAQRHRAGGDRGDTRRRGRDHGRSGAVVSRTRCSAAGAKLGVDDCRRQRSGTTSTRSVDFGLPRNCDRCRRAWLQSAGRCAARRARPATTLSGEKRRREDAPRVVAGARSFFDSLRHAERRRSGRRPRRRRYPRRSRRQTNPRRPQART